MIELAPPPEICDELEALLQLELPEICMSLQGVAEQGQGWRGWGVYHHFQFSGIEGSWNHAIVTIPSIDFIGVFKFKYGTIRMRPRDTLTVSVRVVKEQPKKHWWSR